MDTMPKNTAAIGPDEITSPLLLQLLALWESKRTHERIPARADLDPVELKFILGRLLILDVLPGPRFRFRLHGSKLTEVAGYDMTGRFVDDLPHPENRRTLVARCKALLRSGEPMSVTLERPVDGRRFSYEALWLPLASDGIEVDMLMCGLIYLNNWAEARPDRSPVAEKRGVG